MVAQVDEEDAAQVALVMDPAGEPDSFPGVGGAEVVAGGGCGTDWTWEGKFLDGIDGINRIFALERRVGCFALRTAED